VELLFEVAEQTRYTTLVRLTYVFADDLGPRSDPNAVLRAFHDSKQVEVLSMSPGYATSERGDVPATLEGKWKASLFLSKWLSYCASQGCRLGEGARVGTGRLMADTSR